MVWSHSGLIFATFVGLTLRSPVLFTDVDVSRLYAPLRCCEPRFKVGLPLTGAPGSVNMCQHLPSGYQTEQGLAIIDYVFPSPANSPNIEYLV